MSVVKEILIDYDCIIYGHVCGNKREIGVATAACLLTRHIHSKNFM